MNLRRMLRIFAAIIAIAIASGFYLHPTTGVHKQYQALSGPYCGDGYCNGTENAETCPQDCSPCGGDPCCGDPKCGNNFDTSLKNLDSKRRLDARFQQRLRPVNPHDIR